MRCEAQGHVSNAAQQLVYVIIRDKLVELVPYLDNVWPRTLPSLRVVSRQDFAH